MKASSPSGPAAEARDRRPCFGRPARGDEPFRKASSPPGSVAKARGPGPASAGRWRGRSLQKEEAHSPLARRGGPGAHVDLCYLYTLLERHPEIVQTLCQQARGLVAFIFGRSIWRPLVTGTCCGVGDTARGTCRRTSMAPSLWPPGRRRQPRPQDRRPTSRRPGKEQAADQCGLKDTPFRVALTPPGAFLYGHRGITDNRDRKIVCLPPVAARVLDQL